MLIMDGYVEHGKIRDEMDSQLEARYTDDMDGIYVWRCMGCGFVYDELMGQHERGIFPGTVWEDLPGNWICASCGAQKSRFVPLLLDEYLALCMGVHIDE